MRHQKRRYVSLLCALLCLSMLFSCGGSADPTGTTATTEAPRTDTSAATDDLAIIRDGASDYRIIYSMGARAWEKELVYWFRDTLEALTGVQLPMQDDFEAEDEPETMRVEKELVIGQNTTREDLYDAEADLIECGYTAFVTKERFVLAGGSETGLYFAMCAFFKDHFGIDPQTDPIVRGDKTDCTVKSDYRLFRSMKNPAFYNMSGNIEDYRIVCDLDEELQWRAARNLKAAIYAETGINLPLADGTHTSGEKELALLVDSTLTEGDWKLDVEGNSILLRAGDYNGFGGIVRYFETSNAHGYYEKLCDGFSVTENFASNLSDISASSAYAYQRAGDVRLMYYNVLWGDPAPTSRNPLQKEIFATYRPDVLGLQEFDSSKRGLVSMLNELGYKETLNPFVQNQPNNRYGYNCTPLFYNTNTTEYIGGGFYWYQNQIDRENSGECGPGDCASKALTWGVFKPIGAPDSERYISISTHMCTRSAGVRALQAREALDLIADIVAEYGNLPIFFGGDFNDSGVYGSNTRIFIEDGGFQNMRASGVAELHTANVASSHPYPEVYEDEYGAHVIGLGFSSGSGGPDHILYKNTDGVSVKVFGIVADDYSGGGADHLPLFTDFSFRS